MARRNDVRRIHAPRNKNLGDINMRKFKTHAAQGEVNLTLVNSMPENLKAFAAEKDHYIIGHSESGNHHVLERKAVDMFDGGKTPAGMQILYAIVKEPTEVKQLRDSTPHDTIALDKGDIVRITPALDYNPYAKEIERARD